MNNKSTKIIRLIALPLMVMPLVGCNPATKSFNVIFMNDDGTVLQSFSASENSTAIYKGETPTKRSDELYDYTFMNWYPTPKPLKKDTVYVATYSTKKTEIDCLRKAMLYLSKQKNYSFEYNGDYLAEHSILFTPESIGVVSEKYPSFDKIYYQDGMKVFSIGYNGEKFVGSEYYKESTYVWSNAFNYTMLNVGIDYIDKLDDKTNTLEIKDKSYRLAFLRTIGYSAIDYLDLGRMFVTFDNLENKPKLTYNFTFNNENFTYIVSNFGSTFNSVVDDFIRGGGKHFTPTASLSRVRELLQTNNFALRNYYFDGSQGYYNSTSYFHPKYYYTIYDDSTTASGSIALKKTSLGVNGCYNFQMTFPNGTPSILSTPLSNEADIVKFYHYPSYLRLLKSLEFTRPWNRDYISKLEYNPSGDAYLITDSTLVSDFANNFSFDTGFQRSIPYVLGLDYIRNDPTYGETIMFVYKFQWVGKMFVVKVPVYNFGRSGNAKLDEIVKQYSE